jgi:hypothetical protein
MKYKELMIETSVCVFCLVFLAVTLTWLSKHQPSDRQSMTITSTGATIVDSSKVSTELYEEALQLRIAQRHYLDECSNIPTEEWQNRNCDIKGDLLIVRHAEFITRKAELEMRSK